MVDRGYAYDMARRASAAQDAVDDLGAGKYGDSTPEHHRSDTRGPCLACEARHTVTEADLANEWLANNLLEEQLGASTTENIRMLIDIAIRRALRHG